MDLSKLTVAPVAPEGESRFRALMDEHHYLGAPWKIDQTVWYAADDGSGAQVRRARRLDWMGPAGADGRLHLIANNVRLLLLGRRPNLGSRFLALCGATGWKAIHEWIQGLSPAMLDHFRYRKIGGVHERPSIYCIRSIMIRVVPDQLARATARFCREHGWDEGAGIAVDGKTI